MPPEPEPRVKRALHMARADPVKALQRAVALLRASIVLRSCPHGPRTTVHGKLQVVNAGTVRIGAGVTFVGGMLPTELVCGPGATLEIGDECVVNYGASVEAHASVRIGRRCMLASFVRVCDRTHDRVAPVTICDDVWIAHGAIIEPGITIGEGSVVAAGAVVTKDVPPGSIAAGNPARSMSLALAVAQAPQAGAVRSPVA